MCKQKKIPKTSEEPKIVESPTQVKAPVRVVEESREEDSETTVENSETTAKNSETTAENFIDKGRQEEEDSDVETPVRRELRDRSTLTRPKRYADFVTLVEARVVRVVLFNE